VEHAKLGRFRGVSANTAACNEKGTGDGRVRGEGGTGGGKKKKKRKKCSRDTSAARGPLKNRHREARSKKGDRESKNQRVTKNRAEQGPEGGK